MDDRKPWMAGELAGYGFGSYAMPMGFLKWILEIPGCISSMLRLKQICLVAADLDPVEEDLKAILGLEVAFSDPGLAQFGLRNIMLPIGNSFLEVVTPIQEDTTAGRLIERRGGDSR